MVTSGRTWRRYAYLVIGAALVAPYPTLAGFVAPALEGGLGVDAAWAVAIVVCCVVLPIATGMLAAVRGLQITAARLLLGADLDDDEPTRGELAWSTRRRSGAWFWLSFHLPSMLVASMRKPTIVSTSR